MDLWPNQILDARTPFSCSRSSAGERSCRVPSDRRMFWWRQQKLYRVRGKVHGGGTRGRASDNHQHNKACQAMESCLPGFSGSDVHAYSTKMAKSVFMGRLASANTIPCKVLLNPRESVPSLWRRISATSPMMSSCAHGFTRQAQVGETSCRGQHS